MDCTRARAGLWPPERPRLVGGDVAAARAHVRSCGDCTAYFEQDRALLDIYDRARHSPAPSRVRERVFDALASARVNAGSEGERTRRAAALGAPSTGADDRLDFWSKGIWRTIRRFAASSAVVAAGVVFAVVGAGSRDVSEASGKGPDMFVQDYLRRAVGEDHIETSDPAEVTRFLQRELGLRVEPLRVSGLELSSVEICLLEGRRGAMITYDFQGAAVSHYVVPRDGARVRSPTISTPAGRGGTAGMPIVTWAGHQIEQALVGDVGVELLLRLAGDGASG